jgi:uncharacterized Zn finger protein
MGYGFYWRPYVPVAQRRRNGEREMARLSKKGRQVSPVRVEGREIAATFWGKAWCENLESYSDFENRLPRGRTYVRNGSVIDLKIDPGKVNAVVSGSEIYKTSIAIRPLKPARWKGLARKCMGKIGSLVELLQGKVSSSVLEILARPKEGLFPSPREMDFDCTCPDWADMCKHVAAALYGVGARLDEKPELFFTLRRVDQSELISRAGVGVALKSAGAKSKRLDAAKASAVFGIEFEKRPRSRRR